jgi:hypothetical protein
LLQYEARARPVSRRYFSFLVRPPNVRWRSRQPLWPATQRSRGASGEAVPKRRLLVIFLAHGIHDRLLSVAFERRKPYYASSSRLEVKRERIVDITEVARRSGIPTSTLRFYEEKGLIASIGRRGLRRVFNPGVLERLALIAVGRAAGFSLD